MNYMILDPRVNEKIIVSAEQHGFRVVLADFIEGIDQSVAGHPDMQLAKIGDKLVVNPKSYKHYKKILPDEKLICGKTVVQGKYPEYVAYNIALCGNFAIHNFKYTDPVLLEELKDYNKINVNQGYTKCSAVTTPYGIITADKGIIKALNNTSVEVVEIDVDEITLTGKDNGFIGGTSGYFEGKLFFAGDVTKHKAYPAIKKFCDEKCIEIICLSNDKLVDVGSIIII